MAKWKDYQEEAAAFFRRLGFDATVETQIEGARGRHKIDVFVQGALYGIPFRWIVECKDWKTNVPKEKVLALLSITQDVGADRAFLLSEIGFQSGAIRTARNTNVTLASLEDLQIEALSALKQDEIARLHRRQAEIHKRLWKLHKATGDFMSEFMIPMGEIMYVDLALDDAVAGKFPVIYTVTRDGQRPAAESWDELVAKLTVLLDNAEAFAAAHEKKV